jgi:hypothetical protein
LPATRAKEVLSADDYANYRNIRAVSVLFVVLGSILVAGGVGLALGERGTHEDMHPAVAIGIAIVGMAGAIGGITALRGSRRFAPLVYVMAAVYVFGFPIGTILSIVMFAGLSGYLDSVAQLSAPKAREVDHTESG